MKTAQQRIKIAEFCGWKSPQHEDAATLQKGWSSDGKWWLDPQGFQKFAHDMPDYPNDLNAMHAAENRLTDEEHFQFTMLLDALSFLKDPEKKRIIRPHSEPAQQRSEALLRTIGKWEVSPREGQP